MTERNTYTPLQEAWLTDMESGEFKQCKGALRRGDAYCCLGLATKRAAPESPALKLDEVNESMGISNGSQFPPSLVVERMRFISDAGGDRDADLSVMNDNGATFAEIAEFVRKEPWKVFTNFDAPEADQ